MADGQQNDKKTGNDEYSEETSEVSICSTNKIQSEGRSDKRTVKQILDEVLNCTVIQLPHQQQHQNEDNKTNTKLVTVKEILGEILEYNVCDKMTASESTKSEQFDNQHFGEPSTSTTPALLLPEFEMYNNYETIICACNPINDENMLQQADSAVPITRILPSYSSVMRQGPQPSAKSSESFVPKVPPPSYAEVEGIYDQMPSVVSSDSMIFGPDPLYLICPICRIIVMTEIERERTSITHWIALILCICLCWPCCLLPYYMKSCSYTYHNCPNCGHYFGMYNPF